MDKKQFDKIFDSCVSDVSAKSIKDFESNLRTHADANGKIPSDNLAVLVYEESISYAEQLLHSVLAKVLDLRD